MLPADSDDDGAGLGTLAEDLLRSIAARIVGTTGPEPRFHRSAPHNCDFADDGRTVTGVRRVPHSNGCVAFHFPTYSCRGFGLTLPVPGAASTVVCEPIMVAGVHTARFRVLKVGAAASPFGEPAVTLGAAHSIRWDESAVVGTVTSQRTVSLWLLLVAAA